jgi:prepilin-type processing-associated H-X9-DG protein
MQCRNNLKQLGLGIHQFEAARGILPNLLHPWRELASYVGAPQFTKLYHNYVIWHYSGRIGPEPDYQTTPAVFLCPSDELMEPGLYVTNYLLSNGSGFSQGRGVWALHAPESKAITDGLSATVLASERLLILMRDVPPNEAQLRALRRADPRRVIRLADRSYRPEEIDEFVRFCLNSKSRETANLAFPYYDPRIFNVTMPFTHVIGPNLPSFSNRSSTYKQGQEDPHRDPWDQTMDSAWPATSRHPGGVNALFADGSVKFINDQIDLKTWWALGTAAAGDSAGDF